MIRDERSYLHKLSSFRERESRGTEVTHRRLFSAADPLRSQSGVIHQSGPGHSSHGGVPSFQLSIRGSGALLTHTY